MAHNITVGEIGEHHAEWDRWVDDASDALFAHRYAWMQVVREAYGGEPHYVVARRGEQIAGIMPVMLRSVLGEGRVLLSVPLADEGGLIAGDEQAEQALLQRAREMVAETAASRIELRQRRDLPGMQADLTRVNMEMELPDDPDQLWDGLQSKMRNHVRKARKSGLTVRHSEDLHADISDAFYPAYCENTRDLGSPMHSESFFHHVADRFPQESRIVVASIDSTVAGAAYALRWRDRFAVPWSSSLRRHFRLRPNNLIYWELLLLAIADGCRIFDFGRSPRDSGTYVFKQQWGARPVQLHYCRNDDKGAPEDDEKRSGAGYRLFSSLWRRTPLAIARLIGPKIFARLPM